MGTTKFTLTTEEAQAVRGFLKVSDAAKKAGKSIKVLVDQGKRAERIGGGRRGRGGGGFGQFTTALGFGAGASAVNQGINKLSSLLKTLLDDERRIVDETGKAAIALDDLLRPIAALGNNATRMKELRKQFFELAIGGSIAGEKVAGGMFLVESAIGDADAATKRLVLSTAALQANIGADFQGQVKAGVKLWASWGDQFKESGDDIGDLLGKLQKISDISVATASEVAQFGIRPLISGAAQGFDFAEVGGAIPTATKLRGSPQKALTALDNFISRMDRAEDVFDTKLKGGFIDRIEQIGVLAEGNIDKFEEIFGDVLKSFSKTMVENVGEIRKAAKQIKDADKREAGGKLRGIRSDPQSVQTEVLKLTQAGLDNIRAFNASQPELLEKAIRFNAIRLGVRMTSSPFVAPLRERLELFQAQALGTKALPESAVDALKFLEKQARGAGQVGRADILAITRGVRIPGLLARREGELARPATTAFQAREGPNLFLQEFSKRLSKDPAFTKEKFVEELRRSPDKFSLLSGIPVDRLRVFQDPNVTFFPAIFNRPDAPKTIRADSPEAINQTAQAVKQAVKTKDVNAHD